MWEWCELVLFPACEHRGATIRQTVPAVPLPGDGEELGQNKNCLKER